MAQPLKRENPEPNNHPLIKEFLVEYREAVDGARRSQATTDTEAWRSLYGEYQRSSVKTRQAIAAQLTTLAEGLEQSGWDEDQEKDAKDQIKAAIEVRQAEEHFKRQTVNPIRLPVRRCEEMWSDFQHRAADLAIAQPMFGHEVLERLRELYASLPKVAFDEEKGVVTVSVS